MDTNTATHYDDDKKNPLEEAQDLKTEAADQDKKSKSLLHHVFLSKARKLVRKPMMLLRLVRKSSDYFKKYDNLREFTQDIKVQFERIGRLVVSYAKGDYKGIAIGNIALSVAVLLYLISPIDVIPDFLVAGMLDDMALLTWLYKTFSHEIERFLEWEDKHKTVVTIEATVAGATPAGTVPGSPAAPASEEPPIEQ